MAATLGAERKGNYLTKREEKMTNAPVRTAASERSQHTTETKSRIELTLVYVRSSTEALQKLERSFTEALQKLYTRSTLYFYYIAILYK